MAALLQYDFRDTDAYKIRPEAIAVCVHDQQYFRSYFQRITQSAWIYKLQNHIESQETLLDSSESYRITGDSFGFLRIISRGIRLQKFS